MKSELALARTDDAPAPKVKLSFRIPYRTDYGQHIAMVGSNELLGNWDPQRGVGMQWSEGDVWVADFEVAPGPHLDLEYKYVVRESDGRVSRWKPGANFFFSLASVFPLVLAGGRGRGRGGGAAAAPPPQLGGVAVRDAWDGAVRDVAVELLGGRGDAEGAAARESLTAALSELDQQLTRAEELGDAAEDPTAPHLLAADRMVAAATRKAVAFAQALSTTFARRVSLPDLDHA
ncbi:MAG: carbohydrate-binding-like protein [Monoraphidium minutum]|nr:MAG: carbohydrate-binding-like protein [Monoraphidium minutum]